MQHTVVRARRAWIALSASAAVVCGLAVAAVPAQATGTASPHPRGLAVVSARAKAPAGAHALGRLAPTRTLHLTVALKPRHAKQLAAYAAAVTNTRSPLYNQSLSAGQFAARFAPKASTVAAVTSSLRQSGLTLTGTHDGTLLQFTGSARTAQSAFHTSLQNYRLRNGRTAFAPDSAVRLPASIAGDVQGVVGLQNVVRPTAVPRPTATRHAAVPGAHTAKVANAPYACPLAQKVSSRYGGLTDDQIASAYGVDPLFAQGADGRGQTIAVYELEPYLTSDLAAFDTCYFGAGKAKTMLSHVHNIAVDGGVQTGPGSGESILDLDDVSAFAPGATINVYEAPGTNAGFIDNFAQIIQDDTAKTVTSSWFSGCEPDIQQAEPGLEGIESTLFQQAAAQGQTVLDASGDDGADACAIHGDSPVAPVLSSGVEESQPYVLSVGGTSITDATTPPTETVWNDGAKGGAGGGGISSVWAAPSWQVDSHVPGVDNKNIVAAAEQANGGPFCGAAVCRETPDVSAQADELTGAITIYAAEFGGWTEFGGTSSATPLWAAMLADIASTSSCKASGGLGFVSPKLYAVAANAAKYKASFSDVTKGNNDIFDVTGGLFPATTGYDMATGLGTPRLTGAKGARGLAYYLCAAGAAAPTVTGVSPSAVPASGGLITITGTGFATGSTSNVSGVQVGGVPASNIAVNSSTKLTAKVPASAAGTSDVVVTATSGASSAASTAARVIVYATSKAGDAVPTVAGVSSAAGNEAGGRHVRIYGSGFNDGANVPTVTFGGVPATGVVVGNDDYLTVTVPAYSAGTTHCVTDLDPTTDVCQVQVVVTTSAGSSPTAQILPEFAGTVGDASSTEETIQAASEFDYVPTPKITGVTVDTGLASEAGGSIATITGSGLGYLGTDWVDVGNYKLNTSQDYNVESTGTGSNQGKVITVALPQEGPTTSRLTEPVAVQTEGSPNVTDLTATPPSNLGSVTYAPVPTISGVHVVSKGKTAAYTAGPATGGTELVITGKGLGDTGAVQFTDVGQPGGKYGISDTTAYALSSATSTKVVLLTPQDNPGINAIAACSISGCSAQSGKHQLFTYYPVGNPRVTGLSTHRAKPGTRITVHGANLGFVQAVYFGGVKATKVANVEAISDAGNTTLVTVVVPAGKKGSTVRVRVVTLESAATGYGRSHGTKAGAFTYSR